MAQLKGVAAVSSSANRRGAEGSLCTSNQGANAWKVSFSSTRFVATLVDVARKREMFRNAPTSGLPPLKSPSK